MFLGKLFIVEGGSDRVTLFLLSSLCLAADLLQSLINKALEQGQLNLPIPCTSDKHFPIIQYADDTLIIMEGCLRQLQVLKDILNVFTYATGLKVY